MTDWKQITARIRRARTSKDPAGQLSNLYQKTRDAMVAFELAKYFETSGQNADAAKWYSAAAERFRRSDWKIKAQEAAVRLGGAPGEIPLEAGTPPTGEFALTPPPDSALEPELQFERNPEALESSVAVTREFIEYAGRCRHGKKRPPTGTPWGQEPAQGRQQEGSNSSSGTALSGGDCATPRIAFGGPRGIGGAGSSSSDAQPRNSQPASRADRGARWIKREGPLW